MKYARDLRFEAAKAKEGNKRNIEEYLNYSFESSSSKTKEFSQLASDYKKELESRLAGYKLLKYNIMHFEISAFFQNISTGKIVYIACDDVRYFPNRWFYNIFIRTAENDRDYTGGRNNCSTLRRIREIADKLTTLKSELEEKYEQDKKAEN